MVCKSAAVITILICIAAAPARAQDAIQAAASPDRISIDTFYDGTTVAVTGTIPQDCEAIVRLTGEPLSLRMKKKGKVFGILWMNRDTVTFESVPSLFMLVTPGRFEDFLEKRHKDAPVWKLGLSWVLEHIAVKPDSEDKDALLTELVKLREKEGLYAVTAGVHYTPFTEGRRKFGANIALSPKIPPGKYTIQAYAVRHGDIVAGYDHPLTVSLESFPKIMFMMAFRHSALYGILATVIALAGGLLTGVIFGGGKGGH